MAKKKQPVDILPPPSDDDIEDEDATTDDDDEPQHPSQPQKPQNQEEESDDSDDETEDEVDDDQPEAQPVVKKPSLQQSEQADDDSNDTENSPSKSSLVKGGNSKRPAEISTKSEKSKVSKKNKLFELSHKIWGSQGAVKSSQQVTIMEDDNKEETNDFPLLCASLESEASAYLTLKLGDIKDYVKKIISDIGQDKARELEDQWKALHVLDYELHAKRADMILKQAGAVSDSLKNS